MKKTITGFMPMYNVIDDNRPTFSPTKEVSEDLPVTITYDGATKTVWEWMWLEGTSWLTSDYLMTEDEADLAWPKIPHLKLREFEVPE